MSRACSPWPRSSDNECSMIEPPVNILKSGLNALATHPKATAVAVFGPIIAVGGLIQFGEYLEKYSPTSVSWISEHRVLLLIFLAAIALSLFALSMIFQRQLQSDYKILLRK